MAAGLQPDHDSLIDDPRFAEAVRLFNDGQWYEAHDGFEELWHETSGPLRPVLQGILQLAVAQLHMERGNRRGAMILTGEGLGRLQPSPAAVLGLDLDHLRHCARLWLTMLQQQGAQPPSQQPSSDPSQPPPPPPLQLRPSHQDL